MWVMPIRWEEDTESAMNEARPTSPHLTDQQRAARDVRGASVALSAGAGCGKTTVLTERFLWELDERNLGELVALTFTEKAARELRERVRAACRSRFEAGDDPARWRGVLRGLEAAPIGTFHGFCGRLLRKSPIEAGVAPGFAILEESVAPSLRDAALDRCSRGWLADLDPDFVALAIDFGLAAVRDALADLIAARTRGDLRDWADRDPAEVVAGWRETWEAEVRPMLLAGFVADAQPGLDLLASQPCSNVVMQQRQAFLVTHVPGLPQDPDAEGLLDRIKEHARVQGGGTKTHWPTPEVYEAVKAALEALRKAVDATRNALAWDEAASLLAAEHGGRLARLAAGALDVYDDAKRAAGLLDFDDLLIRARDLLRNRHGPFADPTASTMRIGGDSVGFVERTNPIDGEGIGAFHAPYADPGPRPWQPATGTAPANAPPLALLVDEFQDTDPIQGEILERLAGADLGAGSLFLVGDPKQSIYRFRGAEPRIFQDFRGRFPEPGRRALTANFRSVPGILHFVNALFADTFPGEELQPARAAGPPGRPAVAFLWADEPAADGAPAPSAHQRRGIEARWIARLLARRIAEGWPVQGTDGSVRNAHPGDVALLFRALTDVAPYEAALAAEGLDYHVVGGSAYFVQQEVTDLINLLSVIEDPTDALALAGTLRSPFGAVSDDGLYWLATTGAGDLARNFEGWARIEALSAADRPKVARAHRLLTGWRSLKDRLPMAALIGRALEESGYEAALLGEYLGARKRANVRKLVRLARRYDRQGGFTLADFVARLRADQRKPPREEQAATTEAEGTSVRLMSIHQAKGLEFPIVVLPDLDRRPTPERPGVAFHPDLGPLVRPPAGDDPDGEAGASLGWTIYRRLEEREEAAEALRLFYVATTRARDALILSAGAAAGAKPAAPALALLAGRFDRATGRRRGPIPDGWPEPEVEVIAAPPPPTDAASIADRARPRIATILEAIEEAGPPIEAEIGAEAEAAPLTAGRRPRSVDLDPARHLAPGPARVDRLVRAILADPRALQPAKLRAVADRAAHAQAPAATRRVRHEAIARLGPWLAGPLARGVAKASEVRRAIHWTAAWPPDAADATVYRGVVDLAFRDARGDWQLVALALAEAPEAPERLRLLLAARSAGRLGFGPVARGWRVRLGPGGGLHGEEDFTDRTVAGADRAARRDDS